MMVRHLSMTREIFASNRKRIDMGEWEVSEVGGGRMDGIREVR